MKVVLATNYNKYYKNSTIFYYKNTIKKNTKLII